LVIVLLALGGSRAAVAEAGEEDDPSAIFHRFDANRDAMLDTDEYGRMVRGQLRQVDAATGGVHIGPDDGAQQWRGFFKRADTSSDGKLTFDEWSDAMLTALTTGRRVVAPACAAKTMPEQDGIAPPNSVAPTEKEGEKRKQTETDGEKEREGASERAEDIGIADSSGAPEEATSDDSALFAMSFDTNSDGFLDISEFRELMSGDGIDGVEEDEEIDEVAEVFSKWDVLPDKKLSVEELTHGLNIAAGIMPTIPDEFYNVKPIDKYGRVVEPSVMKVLEEGVMRDLGVDAEELFTLVRRGDARGVAAWLDHNKLPDGGVNDGSCSPLHIALQVFDKHVQAQHYEQVSLDAANFTQVALLLIRNGADLRHECEEVNPLLRAVQVRCLPVVTAILQVYHDKVAAQAIPAYDTMVQFVGQRHDLSPGGGTALHAAAYLHPVAICVSKILTAHPGAGHANRQMHEAGVTWRNGSAGVGGMSRSGGQGGGRVWDSLHELRLSPYLEKQEKEDTDAVVCSRSKTTHQAPSKHQRAERPSIQTIFTTYDNSS
jgi:Ca2+-binding EF-hand superfamily protein